MIYNKDKIRELLENDKTRINDQLRVEKSPSERERLKSLVIFRTNGINELKIKYGK